MATEKQTAFIERLVRERDISSFDETLKDLLKAPAMIEVRDASQIIGMLMKAPNKAQPSRVTEDGMYLEPSTLNIYKVQFNKASGDGRRLYAKRLEVDDLGNGKYKVRFVYEGGAVGRLTNEMKMTLEEAEAFGALYGTCVRCGRTLTREESIERAMGPVCAAHFA